MGNVLVVEPRIQTFSQLDVRKVRQLNTFKINYSKIVNLQYIDKENRKPRAFREFLPAAPPAIQIQELPRPVFPADLKPLQTYSPFHFPKGKIVVAVNWDLYPLIRPSID